MASASIDGSMPSGKLCAAKVASAILLDAGTVPGPPRRSAAGEVEVVLAGLEQVRGDLRALATTFSAALITAVPPTTSDREP